MEKRFSQKNEQENVVRRINNEVDMYAQKGASLPQAISVVCRKHNFNPYNLIDIFYPEIKPEDLTAYKDIKTEEGSFVVLKGDSSKKQYEVININNKDAIVLRDTDNNKEITASEEEITPVITENEMNKLNEAQYNISINGLETEDAATLSQMLSLASQAETSVESMGEDMNLSSEIDMNPMPVDDMGMPMDMEEPVDDIEFDEEMPEGEMISLDTDANAYANPEIDTAVVPLDSLEDFGYKTTDEMSMDDMMDAGMYDEFDESMDFDEEIAEALRIAGIQLDEVKEIIPAGKDVDEESEDELGGEQDKFAKEITENVDEELNDNSSLTPKEKKILNMVLGKQYKDYRGEIYEITDCSIGGWSGDVIDIKITNKNTGFSDSFEDMESFRDFIESYELEPIGNNTGLLPNGLDNFSEEEITENVDEELNDEREFDDYNSAHEYLESLVEDGEEYEIFEETSDMPNTLTLVTYDDEAHEIENGVTRVSYKLESGDKTSFDKEIAEALRIAGVELNEEVVSDPSPVTIDTLPINDDEEEEDQEYHQIDTMGFGKEASEGTKPTMTFESAINTKKITAIYETAKSMYAKKDTKDWMSLDRRYVEKLIKEGVSYEKASKMIMNAKKGK